MEFSVVYTYVINEKKRISVATQKQKPVFDFLLIVDSRLSHIFYRFRDIATKTLIAVLLNPSQSER